MGTAYLYVILHTIIFLVYRDVEVEEGPDWSDNIGCFPGEAIDIIRADYGVLPDCRASSGLKRLSEE